MNAAESTAEQQRRQTNALRIGVIFESRYDGGIERHRVRDGDLETGWLWVLQMRAGNDATWHAMESGEQVLYALQDGLNDGGGVILGSLNQKRYPAPGNRPELSRVLFKDGSSISYDRDTHHYSIDLVPAATAEINTNGGLTVNARNGLVINAPDGHVAIKGDMNVSGKVTGAIDVIGGGVSLKNHSHGGVTPGPGSTGGPD